MTVDLAGLAGGEDFLISLATKDGAAVVTLSTYAALTTDMQNVQIPLSDFVNVDLTRATKVILLFTSQPSGGIQMDNSGICRQHTGQRTSELHRQSFDIDHRPEWTGHHVNLWRKRKGQSSDQPGWAGIFLRV